MEAHNEQRRNTEDGSGEGDGMKAISLIQPWASLIAAGAKEIETRSWGTAYRGDLAIHASKGYRKGGKKGFAELLEEWPFNTVLPPGYDYPRGYIVATCKLIDCIKITGYDLPGLVEQHFGDYMPGRYAWYLDEVMVLDEPIPAKGSLGLWEWR